jgi:CBS domain-containing protein
MSRPVVSVQPDTSIKAAAAILVARGISALPVLDHTGALVGIISEADLLEIEARPDPRSQATPLAPTALSTPRVVAEVMTRDVVVVPDTAQVALAARLMLDRGVKRMPVVKEGRVIGIVSRRDLVRVIGRPDSELQDATRQRLRESGVLSSGDEVDVREGVVTIRMHVGARDRSLAESIALGVPGVLEVRFSPSEDT